MTAPADAAFTLHFDNQDACVPHDVDIKDAAGDERLRDADVFPGVATQDFTVGALAAGSYPFVCSVHPNMTGTLTAS